MGACGRSRIDRCRQRENFSIKHTGTALEWLTIYQYVDTWCSDTQCSIKPLFSLWTSLYLRTRCLGARRQVRPSSDYTKYMQRCIYVATWTLIASWMLALCSYLLFAPSMIILSCGLMISSASSFIMSVSTGRRVVSSSLDRVNTWLITSRSYVLSTGRNAKRINKCKVTWGNCEWGNSVKHDFWKV